MATRAVPMSEEELNRQIDRLIAVHGGLYGSLIRDSLKWLNSKEPGWGLDEPSDLDKYVSEVVSRVVIPRK